MSRWSNSQFVKSLHKMKIKSIMTELSENLVGKH
jgi:hypothetical protein